MKNVFIILLLLITAEVYAQTTDPVKTYYVNGLRPPNGATPPTSPNKGDLWYDPSVNKLKVWNTTIWDPNPSNLALGIPTTTTFPITNSNGTGFTLPSAVAGSAAGLMSATDKTKLDAISGTNTGNQSLSTSNLGGAITINGTGGNTINLKSLDATSVVDANTLQTANGFYTTYSTTGSSNFPSTSGGGFRSMRTGSSALGSFDFWKSGGTTEDLYFRMGNGASTFSPWDIVAGRTWVNTNTITTTGNQTGLTGDKTTGGTWRFNSSTTDFGSNTALRWMGSSSQVYLHPPTVYPVSSVNQYLSPYDGDILPYEGTYGSNYGKLVKFNATHGGTFVVAVAGVDYAAPAGVVEISGTSQAAVIGASHYPHNSSMTTITLPASAAIGSLVIIVGEGSGKWRVQHGNVTDTIVSVGGFTTAAGTTHGVEINDRYGTGAFRKNGTNTWVLTALNGVLSIY